ncbi:MAG: hypothetical protein U9P42_10135 [Candidatus Fermentibacteria bacterium]|nr:hypothetical protein [Candidatus Fermentibacteria bacterium]
MKNHLRGWVIVSVVIAVQFLLEVTLGRIAVAPAVLVPVLVYLSLSDSDYWSLEGAFWSGFVIDLLLHQPPGVSSLAMLLGIALSGRILQITTGAHEMTFLINAFMASLFSDLFFIFLAGRPVGSGFSVFAFMIVPRILFPMLIYLGIFFLAGKRSRETI